MKKLQRLQVPKHGPCAQGQKDGQGRGDRNSVSVTFKGRCVPFQLLERRADLVKLYMNKDTSNL